MVSISGGVFQSISTIPLTLSFQRALSEGDPPAGPVPWPLWGVALAVSGPLSTGSSGFMSLGDISGADSLSPRSFMTSPRVALR